MGILDSNIEKLKLPNSEQDLFNGGDPFKWINARIDILGIEEKFYLYASGYKEAAEIIFHNLDSGARHHDRLVYPIVFLMRQSLELLLKDIIKTCYQILEIQRRAPNDHSLNNLWNEAISRLNEIKVKIEHEDQSSFRKLITDFDQFDQGSDAFRYPLDKKGKESLPNIQKIDLDNFMHVSAGMYNLLYGIDVEVGKYLSNIRGSL